MRQSDIFSTLMILLTKRKVSRDYLAERFSVSKRTVSRYLEVLEDAGIPIISKAGVNGGISIADDYLLDKSFLSEAEIIRLKDALEHTDEFYPDSVNRAISEKLDSANKSRVQDNYSVRQDDLYIDSDYEQGDLLRPKIKLLSHAIEQCRAVEIRYNDSHGYESFRTIEPYTLVFKAGYWYIYAMCRLRGDFRLFRLTRINDMRLTSKSFSRTQSKLTEKLELEYYNEIYVELEFEFFPALLDTVTDWLGKKAVTERGTKLVATAELPLTDGLYKKLLSFGSSIKVLNPPEIIQRLREEAKLILDKYTE